jgi:RNA polymerase sigma-70 factor, ECF subfamily
MSAARDPAERRSSKTLTERISLKADRVGRNKAKTPRVLGIVAQLLENNMSIDDRLVERLRARDQAAVSDLADRYSSKIRQLALRYVKNADDAEEVVQDVLLKVYQKIEAFRGDAALSSWIYRITFNTAMSRLRALKGSRDAGTEAGRADATDSEASPREIADWSSLADDEVMRSQLRRKLVQALGDLPPIYRVPVLLRDIHGLSTEEASAVLHVKDQTLKSRLHRGRMILRDRLAEFAGGISLHQHEFTSIN